MSLANPRKSLKIEHVEDTLVDSVCKSKSALHVGDEVLLHNKHDASMRSHSEILNRESFARSPPSGHKHAGALLPEHIHETVNRAELAVKTPKEDQSICITVKPACANISMTTEGQGDARAERATSPPSCDVEAPTDPITEANYLITPPASEITRKKRRLLASPKRFPSDVLIPPAAKRRRIGPNSPQYPSSTGSINHNGTVGRNTLDSLSSLEMPTSEDLGCDGAALCLWKDENISPEVENDTDEDTDVEDDNDNKNSNCDEIPRLSTTKECWEFCYGKTGSDKKPASKTKEDSSLFLPNTPFQNISNSASRRPPSKGCLSQSQTKWAVRGGGNSPANRFKTPPSLNLSYQDNNHFRSPEDPPSAQSQSSHMGTRRNCRVQFGSPRAVEYEIDGPTIQLTPLPSEVTRQRYSMTTLNKQCIDDDDESRNSFETKQNSAILAEWDEEVQSTSSASSRRRRQKNRRSSSIFTPSPNTTSLIDSSYIHRDVDYGEGGSPSTHVMDSLASQCCAKSPNAADPDSPSSFALSSNHDILVPIITPASSTSMDVSQPDI